MDEHDVRRLAESLARAVAAAHDISTKNGEICMSRSALKEWRQRYAEVSVDFPGVLGAVTSRAEAQVLRLALTYALLDEESEIDLRHLKAALAFWEYSLASAEKIFGGTYPHRDEQKVLASVTSRTMTRTDISALFARNYTSVRIDELLKSLEQQNLIEQFTEPTAGRPRVMYRARTK